MLCSGAIALVVFTGCCEPGGKGGGTGGGTGGAGADDGGGAGAGGGEDQARWKV